MFKNKCRLSMTCSLRVIPELFLLVRGSNRIFYCREIFFFFFFRSYSGKRNSINILCTWKWTFPSKCLLIPNWPHQILNEVDRCRNDLKRANCKLERGVWSTSLIRSGWLSFSLERRMLKGETYRSIPQPLRRLWWGGSWALLLHN